MNTYTHYRKVGLLMGLLGLNALSSCVNTRKALGMNNWSETGDMAISPYASQNAPSMDQSFFYGANQLGGLIPLHQVDPIKENFIIDAIDKGYDRYHHGFDSNIDMHKRCDQSTHMSTKCPSKLRLGFIRKRK